MATLHARWLSPVVLIPWFAIACGSSIGDPATGPDGGDPGADSDGDGLSDADEAGRGTDPNNPDSDGDGLDDGVEVDIGTDPGNADSDGDGIPDGVEIEIGTNPRNPDDQGCANDSAQANLIQRPADIIFLIDTSSSMHGEADAVEARINNDLAGNLESNGVDYRILMLADFPPDDGDDPTDPTLCIGPPLAPQDCAALTSTKPTNGSKFFHYDTHVDSRDSLAVALGEFADPEGDTGANSGPGLFPDGWGPLLRQDSLKFFIEISDDNADGTYSAADFDTEIRQRYADMYPGADPFEYVFHSIIGIAENPAGGAWPPGDTVVSGTCGEGAVNNGSVYQQLSNLTQGLRFPLCDNGNFNAIFSAIAGDVADGVVLPCTYTPEPTGTGTVDLDKSAVVYQASSGALESLTRVDTAASCTDGAYYREGDAFTLCDATCSRVRGDAAGKITVILGCAGQVE